MAKKKTAKRKTRPIITGYLEKVNARIFDQYRREITDMIKGHQGIYALYRKNRLYYVGLASNLRNRIKHHLIDRHKGKWTHFSLYIIRKADHIKELESMVIRIAYPEGNSQRGKLKTKNLLPLLQKQVKRKIKIEFDELFKGYRSTPKKKAAKKTSTKSAIKRKGRPLYGYFSKGKVIYATYKGVDYKAWVYSNGRIKYDGKIYDSPSKVGSIIRSGKATNGWWFWKYKNKNRELLRLKTLKK